MSKQKETVENQFQTLIQEKVNSFNTATEIVLEINRLGYYQSQLTEKLWHIVKEAEEEKKEVAKAIISQKNSKQHVEA